MSLAKKRKLIIIGGPTAVGKTSLSIELAQHFKTSIVSADSRQVYKMMNIGTAKPSQEEMEKVNHYLIDILDLTEKISAGKWVELAKMHLNTIWQNNDYAIVVGGTGFYIKSLIEGLDDFPEVDPEIINELNSIYQQNGIRVLQEELALKDPEFYARAERDNPHRLIRALSIIRQSDQKFSSFLEGQSQAFPDCQIFPICLWQEREVLYSRINERVDAMLDQGLVDEVKGLMIYRDLPALRTVGYQEFFPYFDGEYDLKEAVRLVKRNSRRYAKRQMTWFRNQGDWHFVEAQDYVLMQVLKEIERKYE